MRRVVVVGASGSGKSVLAEELATRLAVRHVDLDALHWGPNWTPTPTEILRSRVEAAIAGDGWTLSGNYLKLRDSIWPRADTFIWLDYPMPVVIGRVVRRSVRRCITKEPLWSNNVESWGKTFFSSESIIVWACESWRKQPHDYPILFRLPEFQGIRKYRFRSPQQTQDWLNRVEFASADAHDR
ncbi:MAG: adenylate kinase [Tepidisphaeraceae bacterium]|jgi:adenylate kinase family enzyme